MSKAAGWSYAEEYLGEDEDVTEARAAAAELGCRSVSPGTGALLRVLAASRGVRTAVEVGTGAGVSGLFLLAGLPPTAVLTTIDVEAEHQAAARQAFADAGHRPSRVRAIHGDAREVLPRLATATYDLVLIDLDRPESTLEVVDTAAALVRPGGVLVIADALFGDRVPDHARRDSGTVAAREVVERLAGRAGAVPPAGPGAGTRPGTAAGLAVSVLPVGTGVLLAARPVS